MARNVTIKFLGDDSDLNRATNRATDDLDRFSKHAGVVGGVAAGVTTAALNAAASAARGIASFIGGAVKEAEDAARIGRVTNQIIESTGGAARVTSKHVADLSESIGEMAGVDDELVQGAANVLLTFKGVRNEMGKGNKIFDRAMNAAADLSAVLGTDLQGSTLQLGKALNDPIKGVTALGRAGVQFTTEQKEMIKSLVETGDLLGAQKIILGEVESQVGGAAEANATATQRMAVAWDNFKESIGTAILPAVEAVTGWIVDTALPAIEEFTDRTIRLFQDWARKIGEAFDTLKIDDAIINALRDLGDWARENEEPLKAAAVALGTFAAALATLSAVHTGVSALNNIASSVLAIGGAFGPWGLLAAAILAVGAGAVYAYQHWQPFRDAVDSVVDAVGEAIDWFEQLDTKLKIVVGAAAIVFAPLLAAIAAVVLAVRHWDEIVDTAERVWNAVRDAITSVINFIRPIVASAISFLISVWQRYGDEVMGIIRAVGELFAAIWMRIQQVINIIVAVLSPVFTIIATAWQAAFTIILTAVQVFVNVLQQIWALWGDEVLRVVGIVWNLVAAVIEGALRIIQGIIQVLTGIISGDWSKAWDGIVNIVSGAWEIIKGVFNAVKDFLLTVWSGITSLITAPWDDAWEAITSLWEGFGDFVDGIFEGAVDAFTDVINSLIDIINAAIRAYNSIPLAPNIPEVPNVGGNSARGATGVRSLAATTTPSLLGAMRTRTMAMSAVPIAGARPIIINMPEGSNGASVVAAIRRYERNNGQPGWRSR